VLVWGIEICERVRESLVRRIETRRIYCDDIVTMFFHWYGTSRCLDLLGGWLVLGIDGWSQSPGSLASGQVIGCWFALCRGVADAGTPPRSVGQGQPRQRHTIQAQAMNGPGFGHGLCQETERRSCASFELVGIRSAGSFQ
jgi:hypothetical protein